MRQGSHKSGPLSAPWPGPGAQAGAQLSVAQLVLCLHPCCPHLPPRECPQVLVAESTASLGSPAIGDIVPQVVELELLGQG